MCVVGYKSYDLDRLERASLLLAQSRVVSCVWRIFCVMYDAFGYICVWGPPVNLPRTCTKWSIFQSFLPLKCHNVLLNGRF